MESRGQPDYVTRINKSPALVWEGGEIRAVHEYTTLIKFLSHVLTLSAKQELLFDTFLCVCVCLNGCVGVKYDSSVVDTGYVGSVV